MFVISKMLISTLAESYLIQEVRLKQAQSKELSMLLTLQKATSLYDKIRLINLFPKELTEEMHVAIQAKDMVKIHIVSVKILLILQEYRPKPK